MMMRGGCLGNDDFGREELMKREKKVKE